MCSPSAPPAPDYNQAAQAQGQANIDAARVSSKLNNPNIISPFGTQTVRYGSPDSKVFDKTSYDRAYKSWQDTQPQQNPVDRNSYFNQEFNTFDQAGYDSALQNYNAGHPTTAAPSRDAFYINDPDIATVTQEFSPEQQALYDKQIQVKKLLGDLGVRGATGLQDVIGKNLDFSGAPSVPGSSEETRNKVIDAMMGRVNTDTAAARDQRNSELVAAGIRPGTKAYADAMFSIDRSYNDARQQAINASGQEATRDFGMDTQRRKDYITELLAQRQTPLNEVTALMSGSQVTNPFSQAPAYNGGANVAPAPVFNAFEQGANYNTDLYNADVASSNNNMKTAASLGMMGMMMF